MTPAQSASASAPLHASVMSMGDTGAPKVCVASQAWARVIGRTTSASNQPRRISPKSPRLQAKPRRTKLVTRAGRIDLVAIGARQGADRDAACPEQLAQLVNRIEAPKPRG